MARNAISSNNVSNEKFLGSKTRKGGQGVKVRIERGISGGEGRVVEGGIGERISKGIGGRLGGVNEEVGGRVDGGIGEGIAGRVGNRVDNRSEGEGVEQVDADDRQREEASDEAREHSGQKSSVAYLWSQWCTRQCV